MAPKSDVLATLLSEIKELKLNVSSCFRTIQKIATEYSYKTGEKYDALREELDALREEYDALHEEHDALRDEHDALREEHDALCEEHDALREEHDALHEEHDALHEEHDALCEEHNASQRLVEQLQTEVTGVSHILQPECFPTHVL